MIMAFNWTQLAVSQTVADFNPHSHEGEAMIAVATLAISGLAAALIGVAARKQLGAGDASVTPAGRFSIRGIFEVITEMIANLAEMVIGEHGKAYVPMFAAIFFFVLLNNLLGILPGMTPATENINTTFAFGLFMFITYNFFGIREHGVVAYLKHFAGPIQPSRKQGPVMFAALLIPILALMALMFVIEMISHVVRPFSLGLRLANVMMGDHKVVGTFLDLVPILVPIPFYAMGLFICCVQAFVFTLLSMVYVALATAHSEEAH